MSFFDLFKRIANIFKGKASQGVTYLENSNLEALIEVEKQNIRKAEGDYNKSLIAHAGLVESLRSNKERLAKEEKELTVKIKANMSAGNMNLAQEYALKHATIKTDLQTAITDLNIAVKKEDDLTKARNFAIAKAKKNISDIERNLSEMKRQENIATLHQAASGMITDIGGTGDNINRIAETVEKRKNEAIGAARVAQNSLDMSEVNISEQEHKALAANALAQFAAENGIEIKQPEQVVPSNSPSALQQNAPIKSMS